MTDFKQLCIDLEHHETPEWAALAILKKEILTHYVIDPCCGAGVLTRAALESGYDLLAIDIHDWGFEGTQVDDFLQLEFDVICDNGEPISDFTVFMNPPFSKAEEFVKKAFELGARKIVCFQRFSWYEGEKDKGKKRGQFWDKYPPNRIYICGSRATCWRHDIPQSERLNDKGKEKTTPTAHAWFVWEKGHPPGTVLGRIYKEDAV